MKRGGPLKRTSGLTRSWMRRSCTGEPGTPKRKAPAVTPEERVAKDAVKARSGGDCEIRTPWCEGRGREFSHRQAEGQGGPWAASNGLYSCGRGNTSGCHGYCHQNSEEARENGWFISAFSRMPATEIPAYIWHQGVRAMWLLDDEGGAVLAPFPEGDTRHPDDIPTPPQSEGDAA